MRARISFCLISLSLLASANAFAQTSEQANLPAKKPKKKIELKKELEKAKTENVRLLVTPPSPSLAISKHFLENLKIPIGLQLKQNAEDLTLVHTFRLPENIEKKDVQSAKLHVSMRPAARGFQPETDSFGFRKADASGNMVANESWGREMNGDFFPTWDHDTKNFQTVDINVAALPNKDGTTTNLLPVLKKEKELSFYVSDDTEVEDVYLDVTTKNNETARLAVDLGKPTILPPSMKKAQEFAVHFRSGSAKLRKSDQKQLDDLVEFLSGNPNKKLKLEGFTDYHGSSRSNERLSQRRANQVKDYLVRNGISADRLEVRGMGELEKGQQKDKEARRVSIGVVE